MDIVYAVSQGAAVDLLFSIRSMYKHLRGIGHIVIVGYCPPFLKNIIHIPVQDAHKDNMARNIYDKIRTACEDPRVSDPFLFAADDHFLRADYNIEEYPYYRSSGFETLDALYEKLTKKNYYKPYVLATIAALNKMALPTVNYNVHTPIIYHKQAFLNIMGCLDWEQKIGYISKSTYCNAL